jgi:hypothetical protein
MALIVSAVWVRLWFNLLMYFVLLKSCLFLKRRDVILTAFFTSITSIKYSPNARYAVLARRAAIASAVASA